MNKIIVGSFFVLLAMMASAQSLAHKKAPATGDLKITDTATVIYNSPAALSLGQNRLIIRAMNSAGQSYGGPDIDTTLTLTQGAKIISTRTHWVWTSVGYSGFYVANVVFESDGEWQAQLFNNSGDAKAMMLHVATTSPVPAVGQAAILSDSKTLSEHTDFTQLTTDDNPHPDFYKHSISEAVSSGKPSIIIFATPDLCRTAVCGPVLNEMKQLAKQWSDTNFVHVEIYQPIKSTNNELVPVPTVVEWKLPSEPWTFLVDSDGRIAAKYEGYITGDEMNTALQQL